MHFRSETLSEICIVRSEKFPSRRFRLDSAEVDDAPSVRLVAPKQRAASNDLFFKITSCYNYHEICTKARFKNARTDGSR